MLNKFVLIVVKKAMKCLGFHLPMERCSYLMVVKKVSGCFDICRHDIHCYNMVSEQSTLPVIIITAVINTLESYLLNAPSASGGDTFRAVEKERGR